MAFVGDVCGLRLAQRGRKTTICAENKDNFIVDRAKKDLEVTQEFFRNAFQGDGAPVVLKSKTAKFAAKKVRKGLEESEKASIRGANSLKLAAGIVLTLFSGIIGGAKTLGTTIRKELRLGAVEDGEIDETEQDDAKVSSKIARKAEGGKMKSRRRSKSGKTSERMIMGSFRWQVVPEDVKRQIDSEEFIQLLGRQRQEYKISMQTSIESANKGLPSRVAEYLIGAAVSNSGNEAAAFPAGSKEFEASKLSSSSAEERTKRIRGSPGGGIRKGDGSKVSEIAKSVHNSWSVVERHSKDLPTPAKEFFAKAVSEGLFNDRSSSDRKTGSTIGGAEVSTSVSETRTGTKPNQRLGQDGGKALESMVPGPEMLTLLASGALFVFTTNGHELTSIMTASTASIGTVMAVMRAQGSKVLPLHMTTLGATRKSSVLKNSVLNEIASKTARPVRADPAPKIVSKKPGPTQANSVVKQMGTKASRPVQGDSIVKEAASKTSKPLKPDPVVEKIESKTSSRVQVGKGPPFAMKRSSTKSRPAQAGHAVAKKAAEASSAQADRVVEDIESKTSSRVQKDPVSEGRASAESRAPQADPVANKASKTSARVAADPVVAKKTSKTSGTVEADPVVAAKASKASSTVQTDPVLTEPMQDSKIISLVPWEDSEKLRKGLFSMENLPSTAPPVDVSSSGGEQSEARTQGVGSGDLVLIAEDIGDEAYANNSIVIDANAYTVPIELTDLSPPMHLALLALLDEGLYSAEVVLTRAKSRILRSGFGIDVADDVELLSAFRQHYEDSDLLYK
eukprot:CAMPEP_0113966698 /NCGR_PEP_ID=MMETSP0011_2-20120614/8467_1 /TAXON_ID=101924 /ORGANISM="Rhodosorus marinus" /LENGTH=792 /DNA_ID=CAMNT_0000979395 /DNA_START=125 /DNA_END=2503 /DNA_ORIENTATION=- /assembly_acc=CAM_ASM_000156